MSLRKPLGAHFGHLWDLLTKFVFYGILGDSSYRILVFYGALGDPTYRILAFCGVLGDPSSSLRCCGLLRLFGSNAGACSLVCNIQLTELIEP